MIIDWPAPGTARLVLSQPKRRNAITAEMWNNLPSVLAEVQTDKSLRALIVTGDGDHFAAGADISEFETLYATTESAAKISADIQRGFDALAAVRVPTIAMIRGACVGGGCGLALCCDIRIADRTAKFKIAPASLGLVYPFGDIARLIDAVGVANANEILLTGKLVKAKSAKKMGLTAKVSEPTRQKQTLSSPLGFHPKILEKGSELFWKSGSLIFDRLAKLNLSPYQTSTHVSLLVSKGCRI